ncbi:MAG: DUF2157 domain-containing protein [Ginsengibacter sp.]
MDKILFENLFKDGLLSEGSFKNVTDLKRPRIISVFAELKILLYTGILLLTAGISISVYKNIDSIGHQVILLAIALVCTACFYWCFKTKLPFSTGKVESHPPYFDYVLLLGCLLLLTFIAYLQFQYSVFGDRYGLATFIPMVLLFIIAYFFDNIGILSLAITNLAAWAGLAVTPTKILKQNDFSSSTIIFTAVTLGIFLCLLAVVSVKKKIKPHFNFTYNNFGINILFIALIAGMIHYENLFLLWFIIIAAFGFYVYRKAVKDHSFYFLLMLAIYIYIALGYVVLKLLFDVADLDVGGAYLAFTYFIASAVLLIIFLTRMNKILKPHDRLQ